MKTILFLLLIGVFCFERNVTAAGEMPGTGGGMMLLKPGTTMAEANKVAGEDPAVKSKLLQADVRQWLLFIDNTRSPASIKKDKEK